MALPPLDSLLDLLPDNTTGQIEPVDIRNIVETLYNGILDSEISIFNYVPLAGGEMTGYLTLFADPVLPRHAATKRYVDDIALTLSFLKSDGSIPMDVGYTPTNFLDIATKEYVDNNGLPAGGSTGQVLTKKSNADQDADWEDSGSGGQAWELVNDGDSVRTGEGAYVVSAGDTLFLPDSSEPISLIIADGTNSASPNTPITINCNGTGNTFEDSTTQFLIDVSGASVEFALIDNIWRLVNFGRIVTGRGRGTQAGENETITGEWTFTTAPIFDDKVLMKQIDGANANNKGVVIEKAIPFLRLASRVNGSLFGQVEMSTPSFGDRLRLSLLSDQGDLRGGIEIDAGTYISNQDAPSNIYDFQHNVVPFRVNADGSNNSPLDGLLNISKTGTGTYKLEGAAFTDGKSSLVASSGNQSYCCVDFSVGGGKGVWFVTTYNKTSDLKADSPFDVLFTPVL